MTEEDANEHEEPNAMDDLEPENLSDSEQTKATHDKAKKERNAYRRHRTDVDDAKLEDDEKCETVFIDNLPNKTEEILKMLKECKKCIKELETQFFEENDSGLEEENEMQCQAKAEKGQGLKQYWCIPLSVDVREFKWDKLVAA